MVKEKWLLYFLVLVAFISIPLYVKSPYFLHVLIMVGVNVMLASSLGIIVQTGQISFAHPAFVAIGAYASTLLVKDFGLSYWLTLPLGGIAAFIVAGLIGLPILRIRGAYFFLVTFAFLELTRLCFNYFRTPFGGSRGIIRIAQPRLSFSEIIDIQFGANAYGYFYLALMLCMLTLVVLYRMERSKYGRIFRAMEQNEALAESLGVHIMRYRLLAFVLGCFFAGLTGAFLAPFLTFINPEVADLSAAISLIIYVIVGGMKSMSGAVVGAVVLTIVPELLRATGYYEMMLFAVIVIAVTMFLPGGIISVIEKAGSRILNRRNHNVPVKQGEGDLL